ncbi:MAG: MerR family transcriptional regulator [Deltaproteobacteria bacterium]|nr:MerR family transcriptional regulator [Deltaproteobacteria bacterium]
MARKKSDIHPLRPDLPIYPIGVAAKLLNVHPRTLRIYEAEGLIKPAHRGSRRMFSPNDIRWVECLRTMIHDQGVSIPGLKKLLNLIPCWEVAGCPAEIHEACQARVDWSVPRTLHQVGDKVAELQAKIVDLEKKKKTTGKKKQVSPG